MSKWYVHSTKVLTPRGAQSITAIDEDRMMIIGGFSKGGKPLRSVELFDMKKKNNAIMKMPDMAHARFSHSSVILNNYVYIIGGYFDTSVHRFDVSKFNTSSTSSLSSNHWETNVIPNIDQERSYAATVVYDDYIYVFGGAKDNGSALQTGIRYKPPSSTPDSNPNQNWEPIAPMSEKRLKFSAVKNGDRIYIIGGNTSMDNNMRSMEIYDPSSNTFEAGPRLPIELHGVTAVSIGNYIVVNGLDRTIGKNSMATFLFNTNHRKWETVHSPSFNKPRYLPHTILQNSKIILCGGCDYDIDRYFHKIEYSPSFNTPRYLHAATLLQNNKIILCGGLDTIQYISFDEVLYGKLWDRWKECILLRCLVDSGRASPAIITKEEKEAKKEEDEFQQRSFFQDSILKLNDDVLENILKADGMVKNKKDEFQRSCFQYFIQKSNDDVFGTVLSFL